MKRMRKAKGTKETSNNLTGKIKDKKRETRCSLSFNFIFHFLGVLHYVVYYKINNKSTLFLVFC